MNKLKTFFLSVILIILSSHALLASKRSNSLEPTGEDVHHNPRENQFIKLNANLQDVAGEILDLHKKIDASKERLAEDWKNLMHSFGNSDFNTKAIKKEKSENDLISLYSQLDIQKEKRIKIINSLNESPDHNPHRRNVLFPDLSQPNQYIDVSKHVKQFIATNPLLEWVFIKADAAVEAKRKADADAAEAKRRDKVLSLEDCSKDTWKKIIEYMRYKSVLSLMCVSTCIHQNLEAFVPPLRLEKDFATPFRLKTVDCNIISLPKESLRQIRHLKITSLSDDVCNLDLNHFPFLDMLTVSFQGKSHWGVKLHSMIFPTTLMSLDIKNSLLLELNAENLSRLTNLTELSLWSMGLSLVGSPPISSLGTQFLTRLTNLTKLDVVCYNTKSDELPLLPFHLAVLTKLIRLNLQESLEDRANLSPLSKLTNLTELNVYRSFVNSTTLSPLSGLTNLIKLNLACNALYSKNISPLSGLTTLKYLDISYNSLESIENIKNLTNLTSLESVKNGIILNEIKVLHAFRALRSLNLSQSNPPIWFDTVQHLSVLTTLTYLNLHDNRIDPEGAQYISSLTNLTYLNLGINRIKSEGVQYLSALRNLKELYLNVNTITQEGARYLSDLTRLTSLDIAKNHISFEGAQYLKSLTNLTYLDLRLNYIYSSNDKLEEGWGEYNTLSREEIFNFLGLEKLKEFKYSC